MSSDARHPTKIDRHIAKRLREARKEAGLTLQAVAADSGVAFQQIQKYANASNRVSASRLYALAKALKKPITYFYPDDSA